MLRLLAIRGSQLNAQSRLGYRMQSVYYRDPDGNQPVKEYIDNLDPAEQDAIDYKIEVLNDQLPNGPPPPFPHTSQVDGQLRELRCHYGRKLYRVLYHRSGQLFILLHIIEKSTARIPEPDKRLAWDRWNDFRERMDANPRTPPRAAGSDAP